MNLHELKSIIDNCLSKNDYKRILHLTKENKSLMAQSNVLSYFYYLCLVNGPRIQSGITPGLMNGKQNIDEVIDNYDLLKKSVQRLAYCEEYNPSDILSIMHCIGATADELVWTINSSTPDPASCLSRIQNGQSGAITDPFPYSPTHQYKDLTLDFIICSNSSAELKETMYYINRLQIPEGISINILSVDNAPSLCAGYNEAMHSSTAQYKVYLHHDVRIIEKNFIPRLIDLFIDRKDVGLIGLIGTTELPPDGEMWHVNRYGAVLETHIHETKELRNYSDQHDINAVLCDGFLLATQYDIPWREDLFDGWDFYDASQCMEFIRHGYKVLIPWQEKAWCLHDCGFVNLINYDKYRNVFLCEYCKTPLK